MSTIESIRSPEEIWQGTENIKLIKQYFQECSAEPERCPHIPEGSKIILMPPDEPGNERLRAANQKIIEMNACNGWDYVVWVVGEMRLAEPLSASFGGKTVFR